ncbi:DUF4179 domain-containing protein [Paenibacillus sp. HWE-109]|uniref:DUF4179 domain-containing protein n=1 Tax=Paenibacillus sp. HWE-109 TaxID=1306526 RepID=UPI001EE0918A|nr:DUF4179 domain-containing protein [Paenibacillus sp. HWE-109]UKS26471.1 DUF4179 domain-containing protein [Paenibacillus sp. HWE-109]
MDKAEQTFSRFLDDNQEMAYPDFDKMWERIEPSLPSERSALKAVDLSLPKKKRYRKVAILAASAAILVATPVFAAFTYNWESLFPHRSGIQAVLQQGLGQVMDQSVTHQGIKLTVNKAIVDDNRTVILYSLSAQKGSVKDMYFTEVTMKDSQGKVIEGNRFQRWDETTQSMNGYFETEWTPKQSEDDVQFTAQKLHSFTTVERELDFNAMDGQTGSFAIHQDGIDNLTLRPFEQGEKTLLKSAITFNDPEAKALAYPNIAVYKDGVLLKSDGHNVFGTPGEHGEYTGQQAFKTEELKASGISYKLSYTKETRRVDEAWTYQLHLDRKQMLSGTIKRELNIPMEDSGITMVLKEMLITPTQIRVKVSHDKYVQFPYKNYELEIDGVRLTGGSSHNEKDPTESIYRFERPIGMEIKADKPIAFIASYQVQEHKDAKDLIRLTNINEKKQTLTTQVGGYPVVWTYYRQDNNLFVQSESADPSFGGVNQTYMGKGKDELLGKPVTANFNGDGNNRAIDMYANYEKNEAELNIFWYYTEKPEQSLKVEIIPAN